jgi:peroxiredoxin
MSCLVVRCVVMCLSLATGSFAVGDEETADKATKSSPAGDSLRFQLPTISGEMVSVPNAESRLTVVCFLGTDCPLVQLYASRLSDLATEFREQGVSFVGVNSNRQDTLDDIRRMEQSLALSFPTLRDEGNVVADAYGATRTPEVFVIDDQLHIRYSGRIDDQYAPGVSRPKASRDDLRVAIEEVLAGTSVSVTRTEVTGCFIGKFRKKEMNPAESTPNITWSGEVHKVIQKHCLECHRTGDIAPFSMETWEDTAGWADTMLETIDNGRMPPWHAATGHRSLSNARTMPEADKEILRNWVKAGMPSGENSSLTLSMPKTSEWQLPKAPDIEVAMRERPYSIPSNGVVDYQYFVVDPKFTEDKWVTGAQIIPGNRSVVHHAIAFIRPPDGVRPRGVGWLTAYVPGQRLVAMPPGHARHVPAGSKIVFQMHYTPNGKPQEDITKIGLIFADRLEITHQVLTVIGIDQEFEIPPGAAHHEVTGKVRWFPKSGVLLAAAPHMHLRGSQFRLSAAAKSGEEVLLDVPRYDFNWQHSYVFEEPVPLNQIDEIHFSFAFDNSERNPFNPDPKEWVTWGDQTWEEMAVVFLEVAEPLEVAESSVEVAEVADTVNLQARRQAFVDDFFRDLDTNGDGNIFRTEVPLAVRNHFGRFDRNGDNNVTREEVRSLAEEKIRN